MKPHLRPLWFHFQLLTLETNKTGTSHCSKFTVGQIFPGHPCQCLLFFYCIKMEIAASRSQEAFLRWQIKTKGLNLSLVPVGTALIETPQSVGQPWVFYAGIQFVILPKEILLYDIFNVTISLFLFVCGHH